MVDKVVTQVGGAEAQAQALEDKILSAKDTLEKRKRVYYVSCRGDDANDGLSPERAIKNFSHIADLPLEAGDTVLFERGSVFRAASKLFIKSGVYFGAYGEGGKPRIYGSLRDYADPSIWQQTENKAIWTTRILSEYGAALITFNDDQYTGTWHYELSRLKKDGDFYHDHKAGIFYLYFEAGNPGEYFDNIEISTTDVVFRGSYVDDFRAENLYFKYFTFGPFHLSEISNVLISNCIIGWCGGKWFSFDNVRNLHVRYGNAIQFWYLAENITVTNCWIYQQFDAGITFQGWGESVARFVNLRFEENIMEYCCMNFEFWADKSSDGRPAHIENVIFKGNLIRFAGYGWGGLQRYKKENQASLLSWNNHFEDMQNFVIADNILDCADCNMIYMKSPSEQDGLTVYGNTYYQKKTSGLHDYIEIVKGKKFLPTGEEELKQAIATFDQNPKLVKWLD